MYQCFETIKAVDGKLLHVKYHQARFDRARKELYNCETKIELTKSIDVPKQGIYRVKVEYDTKINNVTCKEYKEERNFQNFKLCEADFEYNYKFLNREQIDEKTQGYDEVIFFKDSLITDTSIANIALLIEGVWCTPKQPLLQGTTRQRLLEVGFLKERNLGKNSLKIAQKFAIMNALIGFKIIDNIKIEE